MSSELPPDAPVPRLCHLIKWADFDGYGFNLHAEKSRTGQFIGKVDDESPAQLAGLREGDRIIEVNGVNIANENHRQVVERIKSVSNETKLLVVDDEADKWFKERKIVVKSTMPNVQCKKTPVPRPGSKASITEPPCYENVTPPATPPAERNNVGNGVHEVKEVKPSPNGTPKHEQNGSAPNGSTHKTEEHIDSPVFKTKEDRPPSSSDQDGGDSPAASSRRSEADSPRSSHSGGGGANLNGPASLEDGMLNLNMSASEMRQMLANRRKKDPKKEQMDIRQKYDIIQQM